MDNRRGCDIKNEQDAHDNELGRSGKKDDIGETFVRCRLVARHFKPRDDSVRPDATAGSEESFVPVCCRGV